MVFLVWGKIVFVFKLYGFLLKIDVIKFFIEVLSFLIEVELEDWFDKIVEGV